MRIYYYKLYNELILILINNVNSYKSEIKLLI